MKRVYIVCEGQTEETFVNRILKNEFLQKRVALIAIHCGGVSRYSIIKKKIQTLCRSDRDAVITTMLDYYGIPSSLPGYHDRVVGTIYDKVHYLENRMKEDIAEENFIPNLILHEFEALLFSDPSAFKQCNVSDRVVNELIKINSAAETPEHINNDPNTAPSKRILKLYPEYIKTLHGYKIARIIGTNVMRRECKHFNEWICRIENIE